MKRYPAYKDSGIEWIGEIPEGWDKTKFSRIAFYQEGPGLRNWQFTDNGIRVICVTNITFIIILLLNSLLNISRHLSLILR